MEKTSKLKQFLKNHSTSLVIILIISLLFKNSVSDYFTPIYYEVRMTPGEIFDSVKKTLSVPTYLNVKYETQRAFLPYEKIKVTASLMVVDTFYQKKAKRSSAIIMVSLLGSEFTKNSINNKNKLPTFKSPIKDPLQKYTVMDGCILLKPTKNENEYEGTAEVIYRKKGSYFLYLVCTDAVPCVALDQAVDIESSSEVMNKKTNDLLFRVSILTFLIWIYTEFFRRKS